eukprot:205329-Amphidinium_carterae.1
MLVIPDLCKLDFDSSVPETPETRCCRLAMYQLHPTLVCTLEALLGKKHGKEQQLSTCLSCNVAWKM